MKKMMIPLAMLAIGCGCTSVDVYREGAVDALTFPVTQNATADGNKTATLKVPVTAKKNGYQYRCVITNSAGKVTTKAVTLTVQ